MTVRFALRYSDQANVWNEQRHDEVLVGQVMLTYDSYTVVAVPGWRFAHTVPTARVTLVDTCPYCRLPIAETPTERDERHDHCGPLPHTGPVGGPYCDRCR